MKLRNKKTGQIGDLMGSERNCPYITIVIDFHDGNPRTFDYTSLDQLNEEWEDYKPKGPRIEHKDSRKAVWYWSSTNQVDRVRCVKEERGAMEITRFCAEEYHSCPDIEFRLLDANVEDSEIYTIAELCGDSKEEE